MPPAETPTNMNLTPNNNEFNQPIHIAANNTLFRLPSLGSILYSIKNENIIDYSPTKIKEKNSNVKNTSTL